MLSTRHPDPKLRGNDFAESMSNIQRQHCLAHGTAAILAGAALGKDSHFAGAAALEELLEQLEPPQLLLALTSCVCSGVGAGLEELPDSGNSSSVPCPSMP